MDTIFNKVSTIFKERYGAEIKIDRELTATQKRHDIINGWRSPFVYSRTLRQVSFPIFNSKQELNAVVTARPVENKDAVVFAEMAQFLQLTIAEHVDLSDQLELKDETLIAMEKAQNDGGKVVQLITKKKTNPSIQYKEPRKKKVVDLSPIWISGNNGGFNSHIAFSVHDWVGNWAFINAKETPDLVWKDQHGWQNFPQVTLFIPDIHELSEKKLKVLKENLTNIKKMEGPKPLVLVTSALETPDDMMDLRHLFKHYKSNDKVSARVQAHFLVFHHTSESPFVHSDDQAEGIYFLPFSPNSKLLH